MKWLRDAAVLGTACFFAVMWGLVLRERLAVPLAPAMVPRYDMLLPEEESRRETAMGIYMGTRRVGATRTVIERTESGSGEIYVHSRTRLELGAVAESLGSITKSVKIDFFADISPLQGLRLIRISADALGVTLIGKVNEDRLILSGTVAGQRVRTEVPHDRNLFLGQAFAPLTGLPDLSRAKPGDAWTIHLVNPLLRSVQEVRVNLESHRDVVLNGQETRVCRLLFHAGNRVWVSWVTVDGDVLVQGTPFGVTLRRDDLTPQVLEELGEPRSGEIRRRH